VKPTTEQVRAVDAFRAGGTLVIEAGAGSGKTSTLRMLANAKPAGRGLYLAYNKAIQTDAAASFPANVSCRTAHSLAYATHGAKMRHRLTGPRVPAH
jgi:ABC-type transport system involved in cytochrome c biogenesis ATPase subunit